MTAMQAHEFFEGYVQAFVDNDIDGICTRWGYPAFLAFEGRYRRADCPMGPCIPDEYHTGGHQDFGGAA